MLFLGVLLYGLLYMPCQLIGAMAFSQGKVLAGVGFAFLLSSFLLALLMWTIRVYQPDWIEAIQRITALRGLRGFCLFMVAILVILCAFGSDSHATIGFVLPIGLIFLLNGMGIERYLVARMAPSLPVPTLPPTPEQPVSTTLPPSLAEPMILKRFEWNHDGHPYTLTLQIRRPVYDQLKARPRLADSHAWAREYVALGVTAEVRDLATQLTRLGRPFRSYAEVGLVLAFVQQTVKYESEEGEYPRFPVETIVEQRGDCEDFSILAAAILHSMGYQVALLYLPGHAALGVAGAEGLEGSYRVHDDVHYYYCEMTGEGWKLGQLPEKYAAESIEVSPVPVQPLRVVRPAEEAAADSA